MPAAAPSPPPPRTGGWTVALLAPYGAFFIAFWILPLLGGFALSLGADSLFRPADTISLEHYQALLRDPRFFQAIRNTALFAAGSILVILPLALFLAQALRETRPRLRPVLTFSLLLPGLTPPAVLALLFLLVFHGREGLLNQWLVMPLGGEPINWLRDPSFILPALVLQSAWRWTGFITFFLVAGMQALPSALYEAAYLETRSRWTVWRTVTLPGLRPVILFVTIYLVIDAFSLFSGAYVLLGGSGGTADAGLLLVSYTYQQAFLFGNFSRGAAASMLVAPLLLGLLGLCFVIPRRLSS